MKLLLNKALLGGSCLWALPVLLSPIGAATAQTNVSSADTTTGADTRGTQAAEAQTGMLNDIVVTAERRVSTSQRTPASISVRSGGDLLQQGRYSLRNILEDVPGITGGSAETGGSSSSPGSDNPASGLLIRGIQSNVGTGGSATSTAAAAAVYVDDVYNGIGGNYDLDRVEILRGPQGTLYGRSATSGVVAIRTRDPSLTDFGADISGEIGSYRLRRIYGAVDVPIIDDKVGLRLSGSHYERNGYYSSIGDRRENTDARAKLLFKPTDNFSALLGVALQDNKANTGGVTIVQTAPDVFRFDTITSAPSTNRFRQAWGQFNLDLGAVGVTYIPAFRSWKQDSLVVTRGTVFSLDQTVLTPKDHFWTHELRLHSNGATALQWQAGVLSYRNELRENNIVRFFPTGALAFQSATHKTTAALGAFAEATWHVQPETRVTGGIRYDYTKVKNEQSYTSILLITRTLSGDEGRRTFNNVTYKARVEHDLTPSNMIYGLVSSGYSPGDVAITTDVTGQPVVVELEAQTLKAYEIGSKNRFLGNRLQVNGAVFYYDYGGYQTAGINVTPQNPGNPTFRTILSPVRSYGGELEVEARPWPGGQLRVNLSYTHARYHDLPAAFAALFARDQVPGVIPFQAHASFDQLVPLGGSVSLTLHGDVRRLSPYDASRVTVDQRNNGALPYVQNSSQVVGNLAATFSFANGQHSLTGYVRNVGDNRYKLTSVINLAVASFVNNTTTLADPRTYGVVWTSRF